jgi:hypothetical protein
MENNEKFLSLEWFKDRVESSIDRVVAAKIEKLIDGEDNSPKAEIAHPYITLRLVNDSLIVVMRNGNIFTKPNATETDYMKVRDSYSEEEILGIIEDKVVAKEIKETKKEAERLTNLVDGFNIVTKLRDFETDGKIVCLRGTSRSIPPLLINKFATVIGSHDVPNIEALEEELLDDDEYQGLKNFFMWCCLNPRAEVADSLYNFLERNGMKITKQGFFVALRNVVEVKGAGNSNLIQFISNAYNKVKAVWKKDPSAYYVLAKSDDSFELVFSEDVPITYNMVGNLTKLYLDLPNMTQNRFTDNWTRTFDIRLGQVVSMAKEAADWSTQDCARAGLHFAGHTAPYVLCGDTTVFTLHNPMKVVGIGREKGRCWEYLPFMTTNTKEADAIMNSDDFDFLEDLANRAKEGFTAETSKYNFNLPSISTAEINSIVLSLEGMKNSITKRVSIID